MSLQSQSRTITAKLSLYSKMKEKLLICVLAKAILLMMMILCVNARISKDRIIGGRKADIEEFPYHVSLQAKSIPMYLCGGSIIHKSVILTAAHCIMDLSNPAMVLVRTGTSFPVQGGSEHNVKSWRRHEHFNRKKKRHDIALLLLEIPIVFSNVRKPVKLAKKAPLANATGWVTGYGQTKPPSAGTSGQQLMAAEISVVELKKCKEIIRPKDNVTVTDDMLCAGGDITDPTNKNTCAGDSGSPYVVGGVQVGIVSWGKKHCGTKGFPAVYADIAFHWLWILKNKSELLKIANSTKI